MKMNKLIMSNNKLVLNNEEVLIEFETNDMEIDINGSVIINEIITDIDNKNIVINIKDSSSLIYNRFGNNVTGLSKVIVNGENNTNLVFNYSFISNDKYELIIDNEINNNKNNNIINIRGVAINNGIITINATGIIKENTLDNNYIEDIKILSLNELEHTILPNLIVDSENVTASHNATISSINKDNLYYLKRLCLSERESIKLIRDGFLIGNLDVKEEIYAKIKEIL